MSAPNNSGADFVTEVGPDLVYQHQQALGVGFGARPTSNGDPAKVDASVGGDNGVMDVVHWGEAVEGEPVVTWGRLIQASGC